MQNLFSIGEVAHIFDETTETFRHYDRVGLLKPDHVKPNGYRYYSLDQFEVISSILYLRAMGTSVNRIKELLHSESKDVIIEEIRNQQQELDVKIRILKQLKKQASKLIGNLEAFDDQTIHFKMEPDFYVIDQSFFDTSLSIDPKRAASIHQDVPAEWLKNSNIISVISQLDLMHHRYHQYSKYGILSEDTCKTKNPLYRKIHRRMYVTSCVRVETFEHAEIDYRYEKMLQFIHDNHLAINGDAFERNILDLLKSSGNGDIHFIKIYIPVDAS